MTVAIKYQYIFIILFRPFCKEQHNALFKRRFIYFLLFISTDPQIEALVTELAEPLAEFRLQVVGRSFVHLDESQSRCRLGECNIGKTDV